MAVAVLIAGLSVWIGIRSKAVERDLASKRSAWEATANQLATVQQQFRVPSATESAALIAESSRMGALAVPAEEKLNLVDMIGRLAEACALTSVRVNAVAASDSAVVPERQVAGAQIKPAEYAVAVEFAGSFANAKKFVSSLPPSVLLSRLTAVRRDGGVLYQLILSVYELDAKTGS
jgi:hypothetical protein